MNNHDVLTLPGVLLLGTHMQFSPVTPARDRAALWLRIDLRALRAAL